MSDAPGSLEVVCGPMYSGKTEEMFRRLNRVELARIPFQLFKPKIDTRYGLNEVVTHTNNRRSATVLTAACDLVDSVAPKTRVVGIDEAQFFDADLIEAIRTLVHRGRRVILAALDMDSECNPIGPIPTLLAISDLVTKLPAVCFRCGSDHATRSYRLPGQPTSPILLGGKDRYEARCVRCYIEGKEAST